MIYRAVLSGVVGSSCLADGSCTTTNSICINNVCRCAAGYEEDNAFNCSQYYSRYNNIIQILIGAEVIVGNCFPEVREILPDAEGGGQYFPNFGNS